MYIGTEVSTNVCLKESLLSIIHNFVNFAITLETFPFEIHHKNWKNSYQIMITINSKYDKEQWSTK